MEFKDIIYTEAGGIATITINRPKVFMLLLPTPARS